jgi:hypothetical protein
VFDLEYALNLPDGRKVSARMEARFPDTIHANACGGARPGFGAPSDLELIFQNSVRQPAAKSFIKKSGNYESGSDQADLKAKKESPGAPDGPGLKRRRI